jgi:uncharacterized membrane protein YhhN
MIQTLFRSKWQILYACILLLDVIFTALDMHTARYVTKPLLTVVLEVFVITAGRNMKPSFLAFLLLGLVFSFGGDVLLMFDYLKPEFFLFGLGSFLLAHFMYITFFLKIRYSNKPVPLCKYPLVFLHAAILIAFILFLLPYLGALKIPVMIYALALSITVQSSLHAFNFQWQPAGWYCLAGTILFLLSDSLIALGKFYHPFPGSGVLVMITYGLAQWGITAGAVRYFDPLHR